MLERDVMVLVTGEVAVTAVVMVRGSSDSSEGAVGPVVEGKVEKVARVAVSYTHLTLPTIVAV